MMDKDAAESRQGVCVENTVVLTLLPHPNWKLKNQSKYICVYLCVYLIPCKPTHLKQPPWKGQA